MSRPQVVVPPSAANRLLARLPPAERTRLQAACVPVALAFGDLLAEPDRPIRHVHFPLTAFISLLAPAAGRSSLEVGLIGAESVLGATLALGVDTAPLRAVVQGAGVALRISAALMRRELDAQPRLRAALLRHCYLQLRQVSQSAACAHYHSIEARLARWLLMMNDRAHGEALPMTQSFLSDILGVRRVGVTHAAQSLQQRRLISYRRGRISILSRTGLASVSCACYAADCNAQRRLLGRPPGRETGR
jgi:CRP-like cAMP-binding protein